MVLGYTYYKINDYVTAIEYFKKCKELNPDHNIKKSTRDLIGNIWYYQTKPSIWKWWWESPFKRWPKRFFFVILLFSLLGILLPFMATEIVSTMDNSLHRLIYSYQPLSNFHIIGSFTSQFFDVLFKFFSLINWKDYSTPLTILTSVIIFVLVSPNIQSFKGGGIEISLTLPAHPIPTLSLIERRLSPAQLSNKDTCKYESEKRH